MSNSNIVKPLGILDLYKFYETKSTKKEVIDLKLFRKVTADFNLKVGEYILNGGEFKLPSRLGFLRILKIKNRLDNDSLITNWRLTKQAGKIVKFLNGHTNGYFFRFYWNKRISNAIKQTYYRFYPTRKLKRTLAYNIKEKKMDYFE